MTAARSFAGARPDLLARIRAEYRQMPGLRLTARQAGRLFGLDPSSCDRVLEELREDGFLRRTPTGLFVIGRAGDGACVRERVDNRGETAQPAESVTL